MNFTIDIDQETKDLLKDFTKELHVLNNHLLGFKKMVALELGWNIVKGEEKEEGE